MNIRIEPTQTQDSYVMDGGCVIFFALFIRFTVKHRLK